MKKILLSYLLLEAYLTADLCSTVAFLKIQSHSGLAPPPAALHTSPVQQGLSDAGRDINNKSWSRNHSGEHRERGGADAGHNWLCCRSAPLIQPWWQFDGCTWGDMGLYVRVYMHVYIISMVFTHSPLILFFFTLKGDFPVAKLLRKKQLRIPKQHTTMGDIICAMCIPCPSQFLSGMAWLFLICAQPNPPTDKPQIDRRGGGWGGLVIAYCGAQTPLFCHKQLW